MGSANNDRVTGTSAIFAQHGTGRLEIFGQLDSPKLRASRKGSFRTLLLWIDAAWMPELCLAFALHLISIGAGTAAVSSGVAVSQRLAAALLTRRSIRLAVYAGSLPRWRMGDVRTSPAGAAQ